ncbi:hypothetical protein [Microbacterium sp. zg-YB36]|nr:hypothetical protein [Microbacterium sp. zg-YB36]MDL5350688.1 hypothetical protein [Microbacterium sp. zg-YB36]
MGDGRSGFTGSQNLIDRTYRSEKNLTRKEPASATFVDGIARLTSALQ